MKTHRMIWLMTVLVALSAAGISVVRQGWFAADEEVSGEQRVQEALARLENDPAAWERETQSLVRAAAVGVERGQVHSSEAYYVLAIQYQREHNVNAAEALFKRAIAAQPDWSWPYVGLGNLLGRYTLGRTEEAIGTLRKAITLDTDWARPHNLLAVVFRLAGRLDEAEQEALEAIRLNPTDIASHNNYANLLVARNKYDEAEKHYRLALELNPAHPKPYYNLACLYCLQKRKKEALQYLEEALKRAPTLREDATQDPDLAMLRKNPEFLRMVHREPDKEADQETAEGREDAEAQNGQESAGAGIE